MCCLQCLLSTAREDVDVFALQIKCKVQCSYAFVDHFSYLLNALSAKVHCACVHVIMKCWSLYEKVTSILWHRNLARSFSCGPRHIILKIWNCETHSQIPVWFVWNEYLLPIRNISFIFYSNHVFYGFLLSKIHCLWKIAFATAFEKYDQGIMVTTFYLVQ